MEKLLTFKEKKKWKKRAWAKGIVRREKGARRMADLYAGQKERHSLKGVEDKPGWRGGAKRGGPTLVGLGCPKGSPGWDTFLMNVPGRRRALYPKKIPSPRDTIRNEGSHFPAEKGQRMLPGQASRN